MNRFRKQQVSGSSPDAGSLPSASITAMPVASSITVIKRKITVMITLHNYTMT
jgi:hypothetical protein